MIYTYDCNTPITYAAFQERLRLMSADTALPIRLLNKMRVTDNSRFRITVEPLGNMLDGFEGKITYYQMIDYVTNADEVATGAQPINGTLPLALWDYHYKMTTQERDGYFDFLEPALEDIENPFEKAVTGIGMIIKGNIQRHNVFNIPIEDVVQTIEL